MPRKIDCTKQKTAEQNIWNVQIRKDRYDGNWGGQYSMENIIDCEYNMDNGYVEVYYSDGNVLRLKCEEYRS